MVTSISTSLLDELSSLSLICAGIGAWAFKALVRVAPLPIPAGKPTDMGLSVQEVCPNPLPETLPPGMQKNPTLFLGEPSMRPITKLSHSVTGDSMVPLGGILRRDKSKGTMDMGLSSEKCGSVLGPGVSSCKPSAVLD